MKKVAFVNMAHTSLDDRTFYHQACSLLKCRDCCVTIISSKEDIKTVVKGVEIDSFDGRQLTQKEKIEEVRSRLRKYGPDVIVCDNPMAVIAASGQRMSASIIYDVTERYPARHNLIGLSGGRRWLRKLILFLLNVYAALLTDKFIFGEYYKALPFRLLFWKKSLELPYFPYLEYIKQYPLRNFENGVNLLYSGVFNEDRGAYNVLDVVSLLAQKRPELIINLKLIVSFACIADELHYQHFLKDAPSNVRVECVGYFPFEEYCRMIGDCHFFLDLRYLRNTYSLPIKLFYYLACGRPVVYSDLKAIRKEVQPFDFGCLASPDDAARICRFIIDCIDRPDRYREYAENARRAAEEKYNWNLLEREFVEFVSR